MYLTLVADSWMVVCFVKNILPGTYTMLVGTQCQGYSMPHTCTHTPMVRETQTDPSVFYALMSYIMYGLALTCNETLTDLYVMETETVFK